MRRVRLNERQMETPASQKFLPRNLTNVSVITVSEEMSTMCQTEFWHFSSNWPKSRLFYLLKICKTCCYLYMLVVVNRILHLYHTWWICFHRGRSWHHRNTQWHRPWLYPLYPTASIFCHVQFQQAFRKQSLQQKKTWGHKGKSHSWFNTSSDRVI